MVIDPKIMGGGVEVKKESLNTKKMGIYDPDKQNKGTLTPGGEKQLAYFVFCKLLLLQFPGLSGRGVVLIEVFLSWFYRIVNKGMSYSTIQAMWEPV